jgi:predicted acyl esterase
MRLAWAAVALVLPALSGCLGVFDQDHGPTGPVQPADVGYDPDTIKVSGVERTAVTIPSFDGTSLAAVVYTPVTADTLPDGSPPRWGVVVALHGWGFFKEQFEGVGGASGAPIPPDSSGNAEYTVNRLDAFARQGLIAVAYDARGFGRSTGMSTVAGPAEMQDLDAVLDHVESHYSTNGLVGIVGQSYGGGQAYNALVDDPRVTTAVPMYGWVDLYQGLLPGNVPKAEWAAQLVGVGAVGTKGQFTPMIAEWLQKASTRTDLETVQAQMDARSALSRLSTIDKPLFICQGLQETLFPQADVGWEAAGGFTRAIIYTGGHGEDPEDCWAATMDWFLYFLAGKDTGVDSWPALRSVDASNQGGALDYNEFPTPSWQTSYLRAIDSTLAGNSSDVTFTISQRLVGNPFNEPTGVWDLTGLPNNAAPSQFRQDPTASFFDSAKFSGSEVLLGAPVVRLHLADNSTETPYQIVGSIYHVGATGKATLLTRAAHAALSGGDLDGDDFVLRFDWTKADFQPGDSLTLKLSANDPSAFLPLLSNYDVSFTGQSRLELPFFEG